MSLTKLNEAGPAAAVADKWSPEGDMFSFGVIMLELMKGKKLESRADIEVAMGTFKYLEDNQNNPKKRVNNYFVVYTLYNLISKITRKNY